MIVDGHGCHTALHFGVKAKENQDKVPTLYYYKCKSISNDIVSTKIYDKRDDFDFEIVNFLF